jgi:hypothetical protein
MKTLPKDPLKSHFFELILIALRYRESAAFSNYNQSVQSCSMAK